jgi:plastocyanin
MKRSLLLIAGVPVLGGIAVIAPIATSRTAESATPLGEVRGSVAVAGGAGTSPIVVYLDHVPGDAKPPDKHATIKQREKQFEPQLTVVVKGTTVDFPNEDKFFHNVFSVSRPARFDLGLYKSGESKSVEMKRAGTVDVYCNIHPDMIAKVKVLDNPFFAVTSTDGAGAFDIKGVPPGDYPITAWMPNGDEAHGSVTVKPGVAAEVKLEVKAEHTAAETHLRKDGTPYGRYK